MLFWWLEFGARMLGFGARIGLCWKSKFFYFSYCLSLFVNSKHHENDTKKTVMTTVINREKVEIEIEIEIEIRTFALNHAPEKM